MSTSQKRCSKCKKIKASSEFYRDKSASDGLQWQCKECSKIYESRRPCRKEYSREYHRKNKTERNLQSALYTITHRAERSAYKKNYRATHEESIKEYAKGYRKSRSGSINSRNAARKEKISQRTPEWANKKKIERIYMLAAWASRFTDEPLHVDHIIPLLGNDVSGLHVETNMQILPRGENISKHNRKWKDYLPKEIIWQQQGS